MLDQVAGYGGLVRFRAKLVRLEIAGCVGNLDPRRVDAGSRTVYDVIRQMTAIDQPSHGRTDDHRIEDAADRFAVIVHARPQRLPVSAARRRRPSNPPSVL